MRSIAWSTVVVVLGTLAALVVLVALKPDATIIAAVGGLGTLIAAVLDRAFGGKPPSPPPLAVLLIALATILAGETACKDPSTPDVGAIVDAAPGATSKVCDWLEGIDDDGTLRTVCATVEEFVELVSFLTTLRASHDAGPPRSEACAPLPGTTFCATSAERAKGVLFIARVRAARLTLDGGAR